MRLSFLSFMFDNLKIVGLRIRNSASATLLMNAELAHSSLRAKPTSADFPAHIRNLLLSLALTVPPFALAWYFWPENGKQVLLLAMGWPHILIGFLFYFGKVVRGESQYRQFFFLLSFVTLAIWTIHSYYDITALIHLYFFYHAFRDDAFLTLYKQSGHGRSTHLLNLAGIGLIALLIVFMPAQQREFRQKVRQIEFTGSQFSTTGWTLISFDPIQKSKGRDYYFYLQAPRTEDLRAFTTLASTVDTRTDGEVRVSDKKWGDAADLLFLPHYFGDDRRPTSTEQSHSSTILVLLTGGHKVGQTFTADRDNLAGVWIPVDRFEEDGGSTAFVFNLSSSFLPFRLSADLLRLIMIAGAGSILLWSFFSGRRSKNPLWFYLVAFAIGMLGIQAIMKTSVQAEIALTLLFQFVLIFHYFLWYVISVEKLYAAPKPAIHQRMETGLYERFLLSLRSKRNFFVLVVLMNLISLGGLLWYYQLGKPGPLRFIFDYNYFLYFLVFHVTFSFHPGSTSSKKRMQPTIAPATA